MAQRRFMGRWVMLAAPPVVIASISETATVNAPVPSKTIAYAMAGLFLLLGTAGLYVVERLPGRSGIRAYFAAQTIVGATALIASQGQAALMLLVLVCHAILYLRRGPAVAFAVAVPAATVAAFAWHDIDVVVSESLNYVSAVAFVAAFSYIALKREEARAEIADLAEAIRVANEELQQAAEHAKARAKLEERNRIAREVHDSLGHDLTALRVQLEAATVLLDREPDKARAALRKAQQAAKEGLEDLRRAVSALREGPASVDALVPALERLVDQARSTTLDARLTVAGSAGALAPEAAFALYRSAQEAITNAVRHARATKLQVELCFDDESGARLRVADDGDGSDHLERGAGLEGMRERIEQVGGRLTLDTAAGSGFEVRIEVPA